MRLPSLPSILHPAVRHFIYKQQEYITDLVAGFGSGIHIVLPQIFCDTVKRFQNVLESVQVDGLILYAKKANKARCFVECCPQLGIGIDAASLQEVTQALACGVPGEHIGISGPAKQTDLLLLAIRQRCLVAIDSLDELHGFIALARQTGCRGRCLLRIHPSAQPESRFGLSSAECEAALQVCTDASSDITLEGFSFHLSGYVPDQRSTAAHQLIDYCQAARMRGLVDCSTVNIGGGFAVRYAEQAHWTAFIAMQQPTHYHAGKSFSDFYPYYSESHGAGMLADILFARQTATGLTLAQRLQSHGIRLLAEPGRALLDQAGFSVFAVQGVKDRAAAGTMPPYGIITVGATSFSLSEQWFNSEYFPDPLLLNRDTFDFFDEQQSDPIPYPACVGGASCLDSDMLSWRKIVFPRRPAAGDLLVYTNTAGYQMDSNESPFHDLPLPAKIVVNLNSDRPRWRLDGVSGSTPAY
ncbi:alanine racemase [Herbaspirillum sp. RTI4]|uniref:alanine racemase n=1 Tax=Herbaspirillum sp. RTI4 TaxID=3048640 RepID=UPI002AB43A45|nr:alanine racemase [Herbaspirillum sp. RTI4]MDY7579989.1 alanine racemase [Herbaspirillum sp. RTI4]MEA9982804.1 alanine racemase [Herbaspirillum sp. RTI4]